MKEKLSISIAHLYPKMLNLYGDRGNILTLQKRCYWRGIDVSITEINIDTSVCTGNYDIYFLGGGQDKQQVKVAEELQKQKNFFVDEAENSKVFLGICGGYQLFGKYYIPSDKKEILGIGILDVYTLAGDKRLISNVSAKCNFIESKIIVGFENHNGRTYIGEGTTPLATIINGNGNNACDKTEGARKNNVFGTYLHGSFLPKNPEIADYMLQIALNKKYNDCIELKKLDNFLEERLQKQLLRKNF